jgi:DNA-binding response OmpR family regulator
MRRHMLPSWVMTLFNLACVYAGRDDTVAKQRILVVDDDDATCELIKLQLEMSGFEPVCAYTGREALSTAKEQKPSLMILDVMLPEMDGLEVLREIRRFANTPVIMVTARSLINDINTADRFNVDEYVIKPFSAHDLIAKIENILDRKGVLADRM